MAISIQDTRENEDDKTVYYTIKYKGTDYKLGEDIPKDADAQEYLDERSDALKTDILRRQYHKAIVPQLTIKVKDHEGVSQVEYMSVLESFEAWVSAGCKNAEVKGEDSEGNEYVITPEEVIEKKAWVDTH